LPLLSILALSGCHRNLYGESSSASPESSLSSATTQESSSYPVGTTEFKVISIEQTGQYGDATLFKYGNYEILIDGGNTTSYTQLHDYLTEYVTDHTLECLVLTHPHSDHYGGFSGGSYVASSGGTLAASGITKVNYIVDSGYDDNRAAWLNVKNYYVGKGAEYHSIGSLTLNHFNDAVLTVDPAVYIQWLYSSTYSSAQGTWNNNSVLCSIHAGHYDFVMLGDAQDVEVKSLVSTYLSETFIPSGDKVVFKACHHCSGTTETGNTPALLNFLHPSYGFSSSGITADNGADQGVATPATGQHPAKNAATTITAFTGKENFYWNGVTGTLEMTLDITLTNITIVGKGRKYGYGYNMAGVLVNPESEKNTPLFSSKWATTAAFQ
jgi:beta-lactamase superfamily II metal-dependent hydrolase